MTGFNAGGLEIAMLNPMVFMVQSPSTSGLIQGSDGIAFGLGITPVGQGAQGWMVDAARMTGEECRNTFITKSNCCLYSVICLYK